MRVKEVGVFIALQCGPMDSCDAFFIALGSNQPWIDVGDVRELCFFT